mmetsp:Transcript_18744/g.40408  ORF Transcript_18744/g.40408 Transcript_18744/m.40408 type:complete len:292 (+) Transcript_18744:141-1016(+)|eukprot:CAMPEP_0183356878 /NCGR_PEP_ID=MMETSP0164_2-20130417/45244_1 /TAXON_ID=221442 /ORGANISM="Coccolithus pelagicus ssp braarudi, Strain PLY182g" /LENGTH=291 /DNA_ID=CAMNT_0025530385 /DNA_START=134 /DNA_END=1009 /DNA_ORIENTATION=-
MRGQRAPPLRDEQAQALRGFVDALQLKNFTATCPVHLRVPTVHEGANYVCVSSRLAAGCTVVSVGIGDAWELEDKLASRGCSVDAFDPTIELRGRHEDHARRSEAIRFHFTGLGPLHRENLTTHAFGHRMRNATRKYGRLEMNNMLPLDTIIEQTANRLPRRRIDLLTIDCEGCEWDVFEDLAMRSPGALMLVDQLRIELHMVSRFGLMAWTQFDTLMRHLLIDHGFRIFRSDFHRGTAGALRGSSVPWQLTAAGLFGGRRNRNKFCCVHLSLIKVPNEQQQYRTETGAPP